VEGATGLAVWLVIALVLVGLELATTALVALYLAAGAVGAGIAALAGASFPLQIVVFAVVAVATLITTRKPLLRARDPRTSSRWPRERRSRSRRSTVSRS